MILAQAFNRFAFDLDGVVWRGKEPISGAIETLQSLATSGKRLCYVTNNSSATHEQVSARLASLGAPSAPNMVLTSGDAVVHRVTEMVPGARGRLAFVVGGDGLKAAAKAAGLRVATEKESRDASVVLVGLDTSFSYKKLSAAVEAVRAGAYLIASNNDPTLPVVGGVEPGAGALVAAIVAATGATPTVAGKPDPTMFRLAEAKLGGAPALAVGDRVDTDVAAAHSAGWSAALVLTGDSALASLAASATWPEFLLRGPADLLLDLPHGQVRPALGADLAPIANLLHRSNLKSGGARERLGRTVVVEAERGRVLSTASYDPLGELALLRSIAVSDSMVGRGLGTLAVAGALRLAARSGAKEIFLVANGSEKFFAGLGFDEVARDQLPDSVAEHPQLTRESPTAAPTMRMALA